MGNCCTGRGNKPIPPPTPPPQKLPKKTKEKTRPPLPTPSQPPPKSALESIANLGVRARSQIDKILSPSKSRHTEYGEEVLQGYLKATQVLPSQESVARLLVFSNYAVYFLEPLDFTVESTCEVLNIFRENPLIFPQKRENRKNPPHLTDNFAPRQVIRHPPPIPRRRW